MKPMEITLCQTGVAKHAPSLRESFLEGEVQMGLVECFDKCETCERYLLVRIEGALVRFGSGAELVEAVRALREEG